MTTTDTKTAAAINAQTDASLAARATQAANPPKPAKPKATPKPTRAPAPVAAPAPAPRKALTPRERAAKPVTQTIADYVVWLNREVFAGKMTKAQIEAAGISITLYGNFQASPERKAARAAK